MKPTTKDWDIITMLAVLEDIPTSAQAELADACYDLLKPGGRLIITVPSHGVDYLLAALRFLRLIDGMSLEEHYGFRPDDTPIVFARSKFRLFKRSSFQFGLNHIFVFEK